MERKLSLSGMMINAFFMVISAAIVLPFILVISISFTDEKSLLKHGYQIIPKDFSLLAYEVILKSPWQLLHAYGVTAIVTVLGTIISLFITTLIAYTISRRDYRYRRLTTLYILFTMIFSGGIIPMYILVTQYLNIGNTIWALILPYLLNPFYVLIMKGFLDRIPFEIVQSAKIDGASEWKIFWKIIVPLSTPALATVGLFTSFLYWNDWWLGLLFIDNQNLTPLQLLLYRIMSTIDFLANNTSTVNVDIDLSSFPSLSARMAMAVLAAGPMMFVFPFFKRFFIKGITVGSVKE